MKLRVTLLATLIAITLCGCAKKVKLTIDGSIPTYMTQLYLIINEDTANAQLIPINNSKFSVTVTVDKNDFIRLHENKDWPERSFVLIPDSRHITLDIWSAKIEGSPLSQRLHEAVEQVQQTGPGTFHIDVFSDDPELWEKTRKEENAIRSRMEEEQRQVLRKLMLENKDNLIPAWLLYCFPEIASPFLKEVTESAPQWTNHPILLKH